MLSQAAALRCDWSEARKTLKVEWRCFTREGGAPSATTSGTTEMLRWCADSWVTGTFIRAVSQLHTGQQTCGGGMLGPFVNTSLTSSPGPRGSYIKSPLGLFAWKDMDKANNVLIHLTRRLHASCGLPLKWLVVFSLSPVLNVVSPSASL